MACSKIFSGELPELLSEIIQYFRNDFSTLHSCILVNRIWCRLAIPLLWENPFTIISCKNFYSIQYYKIRFIETYLIDLNDNDKIKLNEYGINLLSNTLFNYPSFIKHLYTRIIGYSIEKWVASIKKNEQPLFTFIYNKQNSDFIKFIYKSLIKIFIKNEAILHTFDVTHHRNYFDIIDLVLQHSNFINNIRQFNLELCSYDETISNITPLLKFLSSNCNSISSLCIPSFDKYKAGTAINYLSKLIKSQKNLKKILFLYDFPHSMLLNSNCLNTLNTIIFCNIDFKNINVLNEAFEQLNVLESIHIIYCRSLDSNFAQQIINLTKPFKLKSLVVNEMFNSIELLLQKFGDYLENFVFESFKTYEITNDESELQLLELISRYCMKIKFLKLSEFTSQNIYSAFNLIENIKQNLNYLTIDLNFDFEASYICNEVNLSSIVLHNLGQILPFKLEYLNLSLMMSTNDFKIFLKNSQNIFIKKLLIRNLVGSIREGKKYILPYIKDYAMKKKRIKYFAFLENFIFEQINDDLFSLKDEVKEFKLYDIKVQNYNDLQIQFSEFLEANY
ncbi:uncharacterized protein OCT59_000504 [Rhizophagus irregularis]|uniref:F-box domain-containing protein n=2 Tax=Rhizophagus irregularis TaxID=588596 RepID=A0A015MW48_RHIIW|nr:hypothetical protein GLOIN_2v1776883 [Rhizophagus irregularis DAOM 181602=DAOM 197198]EXX71003.1 hypothetical protein RirG_082410 [Rhizophagus irregularis DAOM 197198w]POG69554.1 hypothetical protein GLOIN_2v1776883 [Rhizophagus irregularis DAOM 181602=DAOM 197198]UZN99224.1 hypothetical protein OCT59_000504 [Rhizophagus irregularis]GBC48019.1 hypothetical protein GLOIN_2v1776883 [Rhizophagus irregularis DAOM 181602=DAOM 197198]|eukprot:XP_025176420.1 hypothetical protein GLOIN_2v1776883 [Rhizophagus irregularis DAOM 181602=DAOM 197198]